MVTREELKGQWNQVKGRLKEHWGQLTDDDFRRAEGSADELVGVVQQRTGATRSEVERFLDDVLDESSQVRERVAEMADQYADVAQQYAADAGEFVRENYERAAQTSKDYSAKLAETVRNRPGESLAIAFGVGIAAGALLFLRQRR